MKAGLRRACACLFLILPALCGQTPVVPSLTPELVQSLLSRIEQLEKRVAELEAVSGAAPVEAAPPAPVSSSPVGLTAEAMHQEHLQAAQAGVLLPPSPSSRIAGFMDANFGATDQRGANTGFTLGQFVLHTTSVLSPRVTAFGELSFTARPDAGQSSPAATGFNAEVERAILRFDHSDYFKVSFGRYHTPVNWWNTAYHHGQWLQTTISRPEMTQFGGRFIPVHFIGGLLEGAVPLGGLNLNYNAGLGNGRGAVISRGGDAGDVNSNRAWVANLFAKPDRFFGLQVGGSAYRDKITLGSRHFREWITSGHIAWTKETPEVLAEFANVHHAEVGRRGASNSQAWYVQLGYRLPWQEQQWKPYYRFEYIHIPRSDAVFAGVPSLAGSTFGLRYDLTAFAALKLEYRNQRRSAGEPRVHGVFAQTAFTF